MLSQRPKASSTLSASAALESSYLEAKKRRHKLRPILIACLRYKTSYLIRFDLNASSSAFTVATLLSASIMACFFVDFTALLSLLSLVT